MEEFHTALTDVINCGHKLLFKDPKTFTTEQCLDMFGKRFNTSNAYEYYMENTEECVRILSRDTYPTDSVFKNTTYPMDKIFTFNRNVSYTILKHIIVDNIEDPKFTYFNISGRIKSISDLASTLSILVSKDREPFSYEGFVHEDIYNKLRDELYSNYEMNKNEQEDEEKRKIEKEENEKAHVKLIRDEYQRKIDLLNRPTVFSLADKMKFMSEKILILSQELQKAAPEIYDRIQASFRESEDNIHREVALQREYLEKVEEYQNQRNIEISKIYEVVQLFELENDIFSYA
jgi:hypothetical protein